MLVKRFRLSCLVLAALAGTLRADPPGALDLIPEDACVGIAIRNLAELRPKSERLFGKEIRGLPRPSQLLDAAFGALNLGWKIDEKKPAALLCTTGTLGGFDAGADPEKDFTIGAILAPESLEEVARAYKLGVEDLKRGKVRNVPGRDFDRVFATTQAGYRNGQVYLTGREAATEAWMKARTLRPGQPAARQRRLDAADGVVYLGPSLLRLDQRRHIPEGKDLAPLPPGADAESRLERAYLEARHVLAAFRVEDGLGLDLSVGFDPKGTESRAVLKAISGAGRTSNVAALPDSERLVAAFAAIGLDRADMELARVLAGSVWYVLKGSSPLLDSDAVLLRRILGDLYSRLRLGRVALYQSSDPTRFGQLAAVAVLEPANPAEFLEEIRQYVHLGDVEQFDPKGPASKAEIEKLIGDLGSDDFPTRESASTKLGLIGDAALSYLEKAEKSADAEVRRRAGELCRSIRTAAELRKQELARGLVEKAFHPTFTLKKNAEKRAGADVHLLGMRFAAADAPYSATLKDFFGPEWNRLRLAVVNRQVVVLLGSETALLEEAIRNVREGKPGLEQSAALGAFRKQAAPERRMELHLALGRLRALLGPADDLPRDFKPSGACSSASVRTGPADMGLDLWVPADTIPDIMKWLRFW
jgi:hypothetical protein